MKRGAAGGTGLFLLCILFASCGTYLPSPDDLSRYAKARSVYAEGRFQEAAALLLPLKAFPQALTLRGKALYFQGQLEEAGEALARARKLRPSSFEAGLYLARLKSEQGDNEGARELVEELLADDSENIRALRYASELAFLQEKPEDGFAFLERAAGTGGEFAMVFLDRARLRWIRGDGKGALEDLEKAALLAGEEGLLGRAVAGLQKTIKENER
ncbi:MAG: tetratricopeptide repeat protein [Spirochaetaceae bacterium]|jgi:tetratricopeptide (TPR) repeat protein|nr:tetratricopeptide repeat protein [Spirochaetaceae bacterium]